MCTTCESIAKSNGALHRNVPQTGVEAIGADAQVFRPAVDVERIQAIARELLEAIGEDVNREGLRDTPRRFAKWWAEFIDYNPGTLDTVFEVEQTDQMVVVSGMKVWTLCEHHLLPFWANISIGYIASTKLLGLSKFARIAHKHAHRLQVQERLIVGIADELQDILETPNVAVLAEGEHLCMTMRGIQTPALMKSSVMRGVFLDKAEARAEFLSLCRK